MGAQNLLKTEDDGSLSFGDYTLPQKAKLEDFSHAGSLYKVKTYSTMTKLEKNGMFLYESVPGTSVNHFEEKVDGVNFSVCAAEDVQITLGLNEDTEYEVYISGASVGKMRTNLSGKLSIGVETQEADEVHVKVVEA